MEGHVWKGCARHGKWEHDEEEEEDPAAELYVAEGGLTHGEELDLLEDVPERVEGCLDLAAGWVGGCWRSLAAMRMRALRGGGRAAQRCLPTVQRRESLEAAAPPH